MCEVDIMRTEFFSLKIQKRLSFQLNHQGPSHLHRGGMPLMPAHVQNVHPMHQYQQQQQHNQQQYHYQQRQEGSRDKNVVRDEYEGLMTPREKQWLLNIQMLQLNTGTPYFDDYYYTVSI